MKKILLAFYGDDFTGSTDALEFITKAGAKTILFTDPPTPEQLNQFPDVDAYGIAGKTRALPPDEIEIALIRTFEQMKESGALHIHYKVCSTFDSSPVIGSIGKAIDCGAKVFESKLVPVLGGNPGLGRYCIFGNLFAKMGIGSKGEIYRIDRHPSMSQHPVTPMHEADLCIHLSKQTSKKIGLIDFLHQQKNIETWITGEQVVLLDAISEAALLKIGAWLSMKQNEYGQLFSVGGSGIETALGEYWNTTEELQANSKWDMPERMTPVLVISGSCSPVTAGQLAYAKSHGFEEVIIDAIGICHHDRFDDQVNARVNDLLSQQKNVLVHTGEKQSQHVSSEKLGRALGLIAKNAIEAGLVKRVVVSGGDTSSYAARAMEIVAVEMLAPMVTGAPLCKVHSSNAAVNGIQINFKGGQVGSDDYFCLF